MRKLRMIFLTVLLIAMTCLVPACGAGGREEAIEEEPPVINEKKVTSEYDDGQAFNDKLFDYSKNECIAESTNNSGIEIPKEEFLYDLLIRYQLFCGYEYDADAPAGSDHDGNIMVSIVSDDMINSDTYMFGEYHDVEKGDDPRGWSKESGDLGGGEYGYYYADRSASDWLAENIFNVSADGINEAVAAAESKQLLYADGDKYYGFSIRMGLMAAAPINISECKQDGNVYYMAVDYGYGEISTAYVKTELKNIDGIWYWTLHSFSKDRLPELS